MWIVPVSNVNESSKNTRGMGIEEARYGILSTLKIGYTLKQRK